MPISNCRCGNGSVRREHEVDLARYRRCGASACVWLRLQRVHPRPRQHRVSTLTVFGLIGNRWQENAHRQRHHRFGRAFSCGQLEPHLANPLPRRPCARLVTPALGQGRHHPSDRATRRAGFCRFVQALGHFGFFPHLATWGNMAMARHHGYRLGIEPFQTDFGLCVLH